MKLAKRNQYILDFFVVLLLSAGVIFGIGHNVGLWEPWEASVVLSAHKFSQMSVAQSSFLLPQLSGHLVYRPLLELWSLAIVFLFSADPPLWVLRLPTGIMAICLVGMNFFLIRNLFGRRSAYFSVLALLTLPMFIFSAKLIHAGIWILAACSVPLIFYFSASRAKTPRQSHVFQSLFALSLLFSFLSGSFFALSLIFVIILSFIIVERSSASLAAFRTRYFVVPACLSLGVILIVFSSYQSQMRLFLEHRQAVPLEVLNKALESGGVEEISLRKDQIIGQFNVSAPLHLRNHRFILSRDSESLGTQYALIFSENAQAHRKFTQLMKERFEGAELPPRSRDRASREGSFAASMKFFFFNAIDPTISESQRMGRVLNQALEFPHNAVFAYPLSRDELRNLSPMSDLDQNPILSFLQPNQRISLSEKSFENPDFVQIEVGKASGYILKSSIVVDPKHYRLDLERWARFLNYGLFPWILFVPLFLGLCFSPRRVLEGGFEGEEGVSSQQKFFFLWILFSLLTLLVGIVFTKHHIFLGLLPFASLCGLALGSRGFWLHALKRPLIRISLCVAAIALAWVSLGRLESQAFVFLEYLLRDPLMKWRDNLVLFPSAFQAMRWVIVILLSFSLLGIWRAILRRLGRSQGKRESKEADEERQESPRHFSAQFPSPALPKALGYIWKYGLRFIFYPIWHFIRFLSKPFYSLLLIALIFSTFVFLVFVPKSAEELSETHLLKLYAQHSKENEKLYFLNPEATQSCSTYADCSTGYSCLHDQCTLSNLSSYTLSAALDINEQGLYKILHSPERAFILIPSNALARINQIFRSQESAEERRNLVLLNDKLSRLLLISNKRIEGLDDQNTLHKQIRNISLPVPNAPSTPVVFENSLEFRGYVLTQVKNRLNVQVFLQVQQAAQKGFKTFISIEGKNHEGFYHHVPLQDEYPSRYWLPGDVVVDSFSIQIDEHYVNDIYKLSFGLFDETDYIGVVDGAGEDKGEVFLQNIQIEHVPSVSSGGVFSSLKDWLM